MTNAEHQNENRKIITVDRSSRKNESDKERFLKGLPESLRNETRPLKVAFYARVAVPYSEQISSFELQTDMFMRQIENIPNWEFAGIYKDECSAMKDPKSRKAMCEMIEDCKAGKIDLILTQSVSRFSMNRVDGLLTIKMLEWLNPPVGVLFESEGLYTLDSNDNFLLEFLSAIAEEECRMKAQRGGGHRW